MLYSGIIVFNFGEHHGHYVEVEASIIHLLSQKKIDNFKGCKEGN